MPDEPNTARPFLATVPKLAVLLVLFLPATIVLQVMGNEGVAMFVCSALGILGTVTLIGKATEEVAVYAGPLWGGLLNATFGNVTELIIAIVALMKGPHMHGVVRSSITGSILGNLLLVLGGAMLYGGTKFSTQKFSRTGAQVNVGMLWVAVIALVVPSLMTLSISLETQLGEMWPAAMNGHDHHVPTTDEVRGYAENASMTGAVLLLVVYVLSLVFSLRTHRFELMPGEGDGEEEHSEWSMRTSIGMLLAATLAVAYLSEAFVGSIEHLTSAEGGLEISEMFIGVIVVAIVGNAAEGMVAIWVARKDKMELSFQIAMGSCLQVALLVAPVLVIASWALGDMMTLAFNPFEMIALGAAVLVSSAALNDGESNWLEGAMFLVVYVFFALVFWFHP